MSRKPARRSDRLWRATLSGSIFEPSQFDHLALSRSRAASTSHATASRTDAGASSADAPSQRKLFSVSISVCFGLQLVMRPLHSGSLLKHYAPRKLLAAPRRALVVLLRLCTVGAMLGLLAAPLRRAASVFVVDVARPWRRMLAVGRSLKGTTRQGLLTNLRQARRRPEVERALDALGPLSNVKEFSMAISAWGRARQPQRSLSLLDEMRAAGVAPDVFSVRAAISACEKGGQWERALSLLDEMRERGVTPNVILSLIHI